MVKGESIQWTKSSRSLDTRPLKVFIIRSIHSLIICISTTMWGGAMSTVDGLTSNCSGLLGACYLSAPLSILCLHLCLLDPLPKCYVLRSFNAVILPDRFFFFFGEAFHCGRESLDLPLQGNESWFVSLSIVGGRHQASEYHATLCLGSDSMANLLSSAPTDDAVKITNEPHDIRTLEAIPTQ